MYFLQKKLIAYIYICVSSTAYCLKLIIDTLVHTTKISLPYYTNIRQCTRINRKFVSHLFIYLMIYLNINQIYLINIEYIHNNYLYNNIFTNTINRLISFIFRATSSCFNVAISFLCLLC